MCEDCVSFEIFLFGILEVSSIVRIPGNVNIFQQIIIIEIFEHNYILHTKNITTCNIVSLYE